MPRLRLESSTDVLDLDALVGGTAGVQVLGGATGLGLPPVAAQWLEGAGDGAAFRGKRNLSRDIDLQLHVRGETRDEMVGYVSRLAVMLDGECTLYFTDDRNADWFQKVVRTGGGDYTYGGPDADTIGSTWFSTVVTLTAGSPYFTASEATVATIGSEATAGLLDGGSLTALHVSPSVLGQVRFSNPGEANAPATWKVYGPGGNFKATSPTGEVLWWTGSIAAGETVTLDANNATVVDSAGANRYNELAEGPRFWSVPRGASTATVSLDGTTPGVSKVTCSYRPRRLVVI